MSSTNSPRNTIARAGLLDKLRFLAGHLIPSYLEGTFIRSRFWMRVFDLIQPRPAALTIYDRMRSKYRTEMLEVRLFGRTILIINSDNAMNRIMQNSPSIYKKTSTQVRGMKHFQPHAVVISAQSDWLPRRKVNESVLSTHSSHPLKDKFVSIAETTTSQVLESSKGRVDWHDFDRLFSTMSRQVIFGPEAKDDQELTLARRTLMRQANRLFLLRKNETHKRFYAKVNSYLNSSLNDCLAGILVSTDGVSRDVLCSQVIHWMFAMNDTLSENVTRALMLILSNSTLLGSLREEADDRSLMNQPTKPEDTRRDILECCLLEAMRLYPSTITLGRQLKHHDMLLNEIVPGDVQTLALNLAWHRDPRRYPDPNTFKPDRFQTSLSENDLFFGAGSQNCAGIRLALLIGKTILRVILQNQEWKLKEPLVDPNNLPFRLNYYRCKLEKS